MTFKCPVCHYLSANYINVARHVWGMVGEEVHDSWMETRLKPKGLCITDLIWMKGNIKLLAKLIEDEAKAQGKYNFPRRFSGP